MSRQESRQEILEQLGEILHQMQMAAAQVPNTEMPNLMQRAMMLYVQLKELAEAQGK